MTVRVEPVDPSDDARFDEWFDVVDASGQDLWPGRPGWQPDELRAPALDPDAANRTFLVGARTRGVLVGAATVELPRLDNGHLAHLTVDVHPAHRRLGVGSALLAACEEMAAGEGRQVVYGWEEQRPGGPRFDGFAEARGYSFVLENVRRELSLPGDRARRRRMAEEAAPYAAGYAIATFDAPWPDDRLGDRVEFGRRMSTDPPFGDWSVEEEVWDADRVRGIERLVHRTGRDVLVAMAVEEASGRTVAFTELSVSRTVPEIAYQWDTLVLPAHRGHRLGLLVKLANLERVAERSPATRTIVTWNSGTNGPMIAVNEALGCHVASVARTWQKTLR